MRVGFKLHASEGKGGGKGATIKSESQLVFVCNYLWNFCNFNKCGQRLLKSTEGLDSDLGLNIKNVLNYNSSCFSFQYVFVLVAFKKFLCFFRVLLYFNA